MLTLLGLVLLPAVFADWGPYGEVCLVGQPSVYDPSKQFEVPWYTIDLDESPHTRWSAVAKSHGPQMRAALKTVEDMIGALAPSVWDFLTNLMATGIERIQQPYRDELHSIADMTGIPVEQVTLLNLFYEISKGCTSIVAEDPTGKLFHARNQDFGTFFIWNITLQTWEQTETLKHLLINVDFIKGGKTLFKGATFAGHLGILTGIRPGGWTLSTNARSGSTLDNLISFFTQGALGRNFLMYVDRDSLEQAATYDEAVEYLSTVPMYAYGYFIVGGRKSGEGAIITRSPNGTDHIQQIDTTKENGWYVLETNYDWDKSVLYLDDRRGPGLDCMNRLGRNNVGLEGLYQVLSSKPNLNKATVYTAVMQVDEGRLECYIRYCDNPCYFV